MSAKIEFVCNRTTGIKGLLVTFTKKNGKKRLEELRSMIDSCNYVMIDDDSGNFPQTFTLTPPDVGRAFVREIDEVEYINVAKPPTRQQERQNAKVKVSTAAAQKAEDVIKTESKLEHSRTTFDKAAKQFEETVDRAEKEGDLSKRGKLLKTAEGLHNKVTNTMSEVTYLEAAVSQKKKDLQATRDALHKVTGHAIHKEYEGFQKVQMLLKAGRKLPPGTKGSISQTTRSEIVHQMIVYNVDINFKDTMKAYDGKTETLFTRDCAKGNETKTWNNFVKKVLNPNFGFKFHAVVETFIALCANLHARVSKNGGKPLNVTVWFSTGYTKDGLKTVKYEVRSGAWAGGNKTVRFVDSLSGRDFPGIGRCYDYGSNQNDCIVGACFIAAYGTSNPATVPNIETTVVEKAAELRKYQSVSHGDMIDFCNLPNDSVRFSKSKNVNVLNTNVYNIVFCVGGDEIWVCQGFDPKLPSFVYERHNMKDGHFLFLPDSTNVEPTRRDFKTVHYMNDALIHHLEELTKSFDYDTKKTGETVPVSSEKGKKEEVPESPTGTDKKGKKREKEKEEKEKEKERPPPVKPAPVSGIDIVAPAPDTDLAVLIKRNTQQAEENLRQIQNNRLVSDIPLGRVEYNAKVRHFPLPIAVRLEVLQTESEFEEEIGRDTRSIDVQNSGVTCIAHQEIRIRVNVMDQHGNELFYSTHVPKNILLSVISHRLTAGAPFERIFAITEAHYVRINAACITRIRQRDQMVKCMAYYAYGMHNQVLWALLPPLRRMANLPVYSNPVRSVHQMFLDVCGPVDRVERMWIVTPNHNVPITYHRTGQFVCDEIPDEEAACRLICSGYEDTIEIGYSDPRYTVTHTRYFDVSKRLDLSGYLNFMLVAMLPFAFILWWLQDSLPLPYIGCVVAIYFGAMIALLWDMESNVWPDTPRDIWTVRKNGQEIVCNSVVRKAIFYLLCKYANERAIDEEIPYRSVNMRLGMDSDRYLNPAMLEFREVSFHLSELAERDECLDSAIPEVRAILDGEFHPFSGDLMNIEIGALLSLEEDHDQ